MLTRSGFRDLRAALEMVRCGDAHAMRVLTMEIDRHRRFPQSVCEEVWCELSDVRGRM